MTSKSSFLEQVRGGSLSILVLVIAIVGSLQTPFILASPSSSQTATINQWAMEKACSYQIFTDGTTIYAQNCDTGSIDYSGTTAATIINDAITGLPNGGLVFIKAGTYTITQITLAAHITLTGEANGTILKAAANNNQAIIYGNGANDAAVQYLTIDGNSANQGGDGTGQRVYMIYVTNSARVHVSHCLFRNGYTYGLGFVGSAGGGTGSDIDPVADSNVLVNVEEDVIHFADTIGGVITGNTIYDSSDIGIALLRTTRTLVSGNNVHDINQNLDPYPSNQHTCVSLQPNSGVNVTDTTITGNIFENCPGYGIRNSYANGYYAVNTIISNNIIRNVGYGIYPESTDFTRIEGNIFDTCTSPGIYALSQTVHISIIGNTFKNIANYAIDLQYPGSQVIGNRFSHILSAAIYVYNGGSSLIQGNVFSELDDKGIFVSKGNNVQVLGNTVFGNATAAAAGIETSASYTLIQGNYVNGSTSPIWIHSGATYTTITNNNVTSSSHIVDQGTCCTIIKDNLGYNPIGNIASPFVSTGDYILDSGGAASPGTTMNKTTLTVWESPKTIMVVLGPSWDSAHTLVIQIDGTRILSTTTPVCSVPMSFTLQPGETFYIQYETSDASFYVSGE